MNYSCYKKGIVSMQGLYKVESDLADRQVLNEEDIQSLLNSLDEKENESKTIQKYKELVRKLKSDNEKLQASVKKLKTNVVELKADKQELRETLSEYRQKEKNYDKKLSDKCREYESQIVDLEDNIISLKKDCEERLADMEKEYEEQISNLTVNKERIEKKYQRELMVKVKELKAAFTEKEEQYQDNIEELEFKNKVLSQEVLKLGKVCRTVSDEMDNHIAEILTSVEEISKLRSFIVSETEVSVDESEEDDAEFTAKFLSALEDLKDNDTVSVKQIRQLISKK